MKKHFLFSSLVILVPFLINEIAISADLMPMKISQRFIYAEKDSADPPNPWNAELRVIGKVSMCSNDYFHLQAWNFDDEGEIEDLYIRSTENNVFECDPNSGIECSVFGNETVGTTWTCGDNFIEIVEPAVVSVPYGGPYTAIVHRKYNYVQMSPHRFEYVVPGLGYTKAVDYWYDNPPGVMELVQILHPAKIIGTWSNGIWYWDESESKWTIMAASTPTGDIAAGDFTSDGKADVASCWSNGLWYQNGDTLEWKKVSNTAPTQVTAGDITGDGRSEIIGTWSNGIWYWDESESKWTIMAASTPTGDIAAGDFTGDGKADVASIWPGGLWYQDGATLAWSKVPVTMPGGVPNSVTAGDVTGDGRFEIIGTFSSGIWYRDVAASSWTKMTSSVTDGDIAAGDFTGDGIADVASSWTNGLWYQDGATLAWTKVPGGAPDRLTTGDVTGD